MYGSAIPRVMSKHPRPQPAPEISHYDCTGVNCTQKKRCAHWMGTLRAQILLEGQAVCLDLFAQKTGHSRGSCLFCVRWGEYELD